MALKCNPENSVCLFLSFFKLKSHPVYDPSLNGEHECITGFWGAHFAGKIDIYMLITVLIMLRCISLHFIQPSHYV